MHLKNKAMKYLLALSTLLIYSSLVQAQRPLKVEVVNEPEVSISNPVLNVQGTVEINNDKGPPITVDGAVDVANEIEIKNNNGDPLPVTGPAGSAVPVDLVDRDSPIAVSVTDSVDLQVQVPDVIDVNVLNDSPSPDEFVVLRAAQQVVPGTLCKGVSRPMVRSFGPSSENNKRFVVPSGKGLVITDFTWTADLRTGALAFAVAAAGRFTAGPSTYQAPFMLIGENDLIVSGSEHFQTGFVSRSGTEVCLSAALVDADGSLGSVPLGDFGTSFIISLGTTVNGYLVDE